MVDAPRGLSLAAATQEFQTPDARRSNSCDTLIDAPSHLLRSVASGQIGLSQREQGPHTPLADTGNLPDQILLPWDPANKGLGDTLALKCGWIHSTASWRWQLGPKVWRWTKDSRKGPKTALRAWREQFGPHLSDAALQEVTTALDLLMDDEEAVPPTPSTGRRARASRQPYGTPVHSPASLVTSPQRAAPRTRSQNQMHEDARPSHQRLGPERQAIHPFVPPSPEQSAGIMEFTAESLLAAQIPTQHHLPKSCIEQTMSLIAHMGAAMEDPSLSTEQRRAVRVLFYLLPRLLWPEPKRPQTGRLLPHARPNLLKQRLIQAHNGQWLELLQNTVLREHGGSLASTPSADLARQPATPGLIDDRCLEAIRAASQRNQVGKAWKHLWSFGVPGRDEQTALHLQEKLCGDGDRGMVAAPACPANHGQDLILRCTDDIWDMALKTFRRGKCQDGLGWSQDLFFLVATHAATSRTVRAAVLSLLLNDGDYRVKQLVGHSRIVPLFKNDSGQLRPISVPTTWRKCAGALALCCWKGDILQWMGDRQYCAGRSHGSSLLAAHLSDLLHRKPHLVHFHLDLKDAFTSLSRISAWEALSQCNPAPCSFPMDLVIRSKHSVDPSGSRQSHHGAFAPGHSPRRPNEFLLFLCYPRVVHEGLYQESGAA